MIVGVDVSNARDGSGLSYTTNLLASAVPEAAGIERLIVWGCGELLDALPERSFLERAHDPLLDRSLIHRTYWQRRRLPRLAAGRCDLLWIAGGQPAAKFHPLVATCHNLLPFEPRERRRYGFSYQRLRLALLQRAVGATLRRADGVIFFSRHAHDTVRAQTHVAGRIAVIPHGVEERFRSAPRPQRPLACCTAEDPFRLLYLSTVDVYKHQEEVAVAVAALRARGLPVAIDFVGPAYPPTLRRLAPMLRRLDPEECFLCYTGPAPFSEIPALLRKAEAFVFASSCEAMPLILIEAMAAGLPIAASSRGPMPELLGEAGVRFDPEDPASIATAIETLLRDEALRARSAAAAHARALELSWERAARETLSFLAAVGARRSGVARGAIRPYSSG